MKLVERAIGLREAQGRSLGVLKGVRQDGQHVRVPGAERWRGDKEESDCRVRIGKLALIGDQEAANDDPAHAVADKDDVGDGPKVIDPEVFAQRVGRIGDAVGS